MLTVTDNRKVVAGNFRLLLVIFLKNLCIKFSYKKTYNRRRKVIQLSLIQWHIMQKYGLYQLQSFRFYAEKRKIFRRFPYYFRDRKNSFQNAKETRTKIPPLNIFMPFSGVCLFDFDQVTVCRVICKFIYLVSVMENAEHKSIVFG